MNSEELKKISIVDCTPKECFRTEEEFMSYYVNNRESVWDVIHSIRDNGLRMEMIEKAIIIEQRLDAMRDK